MLKRPVHVDPDLVCSLSAIADASFVRFPDRLFFFGNRVKISLFPPPSCFFFSNPQHPRWPPSLGASEEIRMIHIPNKVLAELFLSPLSSLLFFCSSLRSPGERPSLCFGLLSHSFFWYAFNRRRVHRIPFREERRGPRCVPLFMPLSTPLYLSRWRRGLPVGRD